MSKANMKVLVLYFEGAQIEFCASAFNGMEEVYVDDVLVSKKRNLISTRSTHQFELPSRGQVELRTKMHLTGLSVDYELIAGEEILDSGERNIDFIGAKESGDATQESVTGQGANPRPDSSLPAKPPTPWLSFAGLGLKLFKSAGVVKAALFGASYASFAVLTDWRLGALLIAILVFHEYGHLRAMRSFGMQTKGMYLIPFVGGVAVGEKASTYWQETYISMQGPVFGLYMTLLAWLGYALTGWSLLGALASFSALINVFNLLPIYPLDGGHVVKACAMSLSGGSSWLFVIAFAAFGVGISVWSGLLLLAFFSVLGAVDLLGAQRTMRDEHVTPMNLYAVSVSLAWYLGTIGVFLLVMYQMFLAQVPGGEIPMLILRDG